MYRSLIKVFGQEEADTLMALLRPVGWSRSYVTVTEIRRFRLYRKLTEVLGDKYAEALVSLLPQTR
ncbi:MAG: hypothetical protein OXF75_11435 [Acidimicrobiaceae bacterium]|nr:hypothetical protein [Acidimicrobiaceae bacterium]